MHAGRGLILQMRVRIFELGKHSLYILYNFILVSFNVKDLQSDVKRVRVFQWLREEEFDVIFLQETHSDEKYEQVWMHQ